MRKKITVVIPVKNGEKTLYDCLFSIKKQNISSLVEILIVDSGSTDCSAEISRQFDDVRVIQIDPHNFNHGLTRQNSLEFVNTEFVLFTVQDAVLRDENTINLMLSHLRDNEIAAVCGKQVVKKSPHNNPLNWFKPISEPGYRKVQWSESENSTDDLFKMTFWDNVSALYRTKTLFEIPFKECVFGEDRLWARDALKSGEYLVYDDRAQFYHYHHETYSDRYKRAILVYLFELKNFGMLRSERFTFYRMFIYPILFIIYKLHPLKWILYNIKLELASYRAFSFIKRRVHSVDEAEEYVRLLTLKDVPLGKIKK